jgi:hypothetical protein
MEPFELLKYDSRLLPSHKNYHENLSPIIEEGENKTKLVEYSSNSESSSDCHVFMASIRDHGDNDEPGREYNDKLLADMSADECTADASQDEDEKRRGIRKAKNTKRAKCRRNAQARARNPPHHRNLDDAFAAFDNREYNTPFGNIAKAAMLI